MLSVGDNLNQRRTLHNNMVCGHIAVNDSVIVHLSAEIETDSALCGPVIVPEKVSDHAKSTATTCRVAHEDGDNTTNTVLATAPREVSWQICVAAAVAAANPVLLGDRPVQSSSVCGPATHVEERWMHLFSMVY